MARAVPEATSPSSQTVAVSWHKDSHFVQWSWASEASHKASLVGVYSGLSHLLLRKEGPSGAADVYSCVLPKSLNTWVGKEERKKKRDQRMSESCPGILETR